MLKQHGPYVKANFRMISYGMDEQSETFKKSYPDTFVRYFFRFVKALQGKRGGAIDFKKAKKRL
jgi:hypothetical protein